VPAEDVEGGAGGSDRRLFGTDGIRGVANLEPVTAETATRLGRALAQWCRQQGRQRPQIIIGKDTRLSGDMLEAAAAAGICSAGADVLLAGVLPTPGVACLTRSVPADAAVVISASHNPFEDNGFKCFARTGYKLPDAVEAEIERAMHADSAGAPHPTAGALGRIGRLADAVERYGAFVKNAWPHYLSLEGVKVAVDCAHGAAYRVAPHVLEELGADVVALGVSPDGENINRESGALHPEGLQAAVRAEQAQVGIALDGDADRVVLLDEGGELIDGDEVLAILATAMLAQGTLKRATLVATVMSNLGLELALREQGGRVVRAPVGDRYVIDEMLRGGYNLGGEQSGHIILLDHTTTGDGLVAALTVVRLMLEADKPLSALKRAMHKLPQALLNVPVRQRKELLTVPGVRQAIDDVAKALGERGRVVVRYSGTEPLLRIMVEGEDASRVQAYANHIAAAARAQLG
jgi:phosphoglucosamine mutase